MNSSNERLPLPWRFEERNVGIADTGDYDGVITIRAANGNAVAEAWNPSDEQEAAFRQIIEEMNRGAVETGMPQPIPVTEIVSALEREAANTDTDPRWLAAMDLRRMTGYERRTLMCRVDQGTGEYSAQKAESNRG